MLIHDTILKMFEKMYKLKELMELHSKDIEDVVNNIVAKELFFMKSYSGAARLGELAYTM
jgi:hypothetical protein